MKLEVKGLPQLKRELERLSLAAQTRLLRNATMAAARIGARHARAKVPVLTGALKRSIKARRDPNKQRGLVQSLVNAKSPIAHLVEFGTVHMSPQAFLRPAIDDHVGEIVQKFADNFRTGLERETKRQSQREDRGEV